MRQAEVRQMRLAATLTPDRGAFRRAIRLAGTMRGGDGAPRDIDILDLSPTGFLAELPDGVRLDPGARVRVAATPLGRHQAMVVRSEGRRHGFVFIQPLSRDAIDGIGPQVPNVQPLFAASPARAPKLAIESPRLSPRASLGLIALTASGLWSGLALLLYLTV